MAYNNDHEDEEPFHVTHTFTPAIHSKSWPTSYYFWFNQRMFNRKNRSELDDRWPSADQVTIYIRTPLHGEKGTEHKN